MFNNAAVLLVDQVHYSLTQNETPFDASQTSLLIEEG